MSDALVTTRGCLMEFKWDQFNQSELAYPQSLSESGYYNLKYKLHQKREIREQGGQIFGSPVS